MAGFRFCTRSVSAGDSFRIVASMNIQVVTYNMSSGTSDAGTVEGNLTIKDSTGADIASEQIPLGPGDGDTIISGSPLQPIDGVTFTVTTGTLYLKMGQ